MDMPSSDRPRERLLSYGAKSLSTAELLAILLGTGQGPGKLSAVGLGQLILQEMGQNQRDPLTAFRDVSAHDLEQISGVGPAKKAALRSFGIETAADVTWNKVISVKGFGEVLTRAVVDWRKACERRFVFNPNLLLTEADKNAVRAKIVSRKRTLETTLNSGAAELQRLRKDMTNNANSLSPALRAICQNLAQAQADLNVF
jgi:DNA-binding helix-hairpin-helix protein with protein kinase domain